MKLGTSKLVIITLPLLPLSSYAHINIDNLKHQCENLKPGSEIVIQMTQKELNKHLQGKLKDGSFFEYDPKTKKVIIYKPKKKNYACAEEALDSGWNVQDAVDACSDIGIDEDGANVDWSDTTKKAEQVAQKEKQVAQKEKQVAQKEKQVAQKEKQVAQKEKIKYLAYQSLNFNKGLAIILQNYKKLSKTEVEERLKELNKIISNYSVIGDERERENIIEGLGALKLIYVNEKKILKILNEIEKKVRASKLNHFIASR